MNKTKAQQDCLVVKAAWRMRGEVEQAGSGESARKKEKTEHAISKVVSQSGGSAEH